MSSSWVKPGSSTGCARRGARARQNGALHHIHPQELLAQCLQRGRAGRTGVSTDGRSRTSSPATPAASATTAPTSPAWPCSSAGWPFATPGLTINRFCGSGQQAVGMAATGVLSGHQDLVIGGGVESMSRPFAAGYDGAPGTMDGDNPLVREKYPLIPQGISADLIATVEGFSRDRLRRASPSPARSAPPRPSPRGASTAASSRCTTTTARSPSTTRSSPAPARRSRASPSSAPSFARDGRRTVRQVRRRDVRRDVPAHLPAASTRSTTSTTPATRSGVVDGASAILVASSDYARAHGARRRGPASS